jgi:FKBP-type peptidyl-prolyl cis-trans isomerase FkpA
MKKWFFLGTISALIFSSCTKDDTNVAVCTSFAPTTVAPDSQKVYLQTYLRSNNINNAVEKNGMFYVINTQGTGVTPTLCSNLFVTYIGYRILGTTTGTEFESTPAGTPSQFVLNALIPAWQIALPNLKVGGTVTLYIPPSLAYGEAGSGNIAGNTYLKFQISLLGVQ